MRPLHFLRYLYIVVTLKIELALFYYGYIWLWGTWRIGQLKSLGNFILELLASNMDQLNGEWKTLCYKVLSTECAACTPKDVGTRAPYPYPGIEILPIFILTLHDVHDWRLIARDPIIWHVFKMCDVTCLIKARPNNTPSSLWHDLPCIQCAKC